MNTQLKIEGLAGKHRAFDIGVVPECEPGDLSIDIGKQRFLVQNGTKAKVEYSGCELKEEKIEWRIIGPESAEVEGTSIELIPKEGRYVLELRYGDERADEVNFSSHRCKGIIENPEVTDIAMIDSVDDEDEYDARTNSVLFCQPRLGRLVNSTVGFSTDVEWRLTGGGFTLDFVKFVEVEVGISSVFHSVAGHEVKDRVRKWAGSDQPHVEGIFSFSETKSRTIRADQKRSLRSYGNVWSKYKRRIPPFWGEASE